MTIDLEWAVAEIDAFLRVTSQVVPETGPGVVYLGTVMRGPKIEADGSAHVVEQILNRVLPDWAADRPDKDKDYRWLRTQAARGKAALTRAQELAEKLGDNAPSLSASALHPWVWENGKTFWRTCHFPQAVLQAALRINAETQTKVGRLNVSETALFNEVFTLDPPVPGKPRLRLMPDDGSRTYTSLHRGARAFAEGLYASIRNPGSHQLAQVNDEQLALEQLAAFSLLARWVDDATVLK